MNPTLKILQPTVELAAIYAKIPKLDCKKKCFGSCGPIVMSHAESRVIHQHCGSPIQVGQGGICEKLTLSGLCSIYSLRPLVCRLFGTCEELQCPFGCVPERWLTSEEVRQLFQECRSLA